MEPKTPYDMTPEQEMEPYVRRVADQLMVAEANGYTVEEIAQAAVETAKRVRREIAAQELQRKPRDVMDTGKPIKPEQRCHYRDCEHKRLRGWTTCARHKTAGIGIRQWNQRQQDFSPRSTR